MWSPGRPRAVAVAAGAGGGSDQGPVSAAAISAQQAAQDAAAAAQHAAQGAVEAAPGLADDWVEAKADVEETVIDTMQEAGRAVSESKTDEVEVYQDARSPVEQARELFETNKVVRGGALASSMFLGVTFAIAVFRVVSRYNSPKAKRSRTVNKNKLVVEGVQQLVDEGRQALTPRALQEVRSKTGFSSQEVFRKYLWFLLRERQFGVDAVADMVALKAALGLSDQEVADALRERALRIYEKFGNVMLEVSGMTKAGVERKATCRALFSKLLYLAECEDLLPQESEAAKSTNLRDVFGATEDDVAKLRIVSLYEVDMGKLDDMATSDD